MNRAIGNLVEGNHPTVSHEGSMIREILEDKDYTLLNSIQGAEGGPWTWVSRADSSVKICLDLVVISANLKPYLTKVLVDKDHKYSAKKVGIAGGKEKAVRSDHFPILVKLEEMPIAKLKKFYESSWNLNKPNGWKAYNDVLEAAAKGLEEIVEDERLSEGEVVKKFDAITKKG